MEMRVIIAAIVIVAMASVVDSEGFHLAGWLIAGVGLWLAISLEAYVRGDVK